ncbi:MAG: T9SS type A sorting domain-containing protein [Bacteroidetes bacterium]|nr:T9SS type A sorting domain-containing protein [Bacteroidota bacterium]
MKKIKNSIKWILLPIIIIFLFPQLSFSQAIKWQKEEGMWRSDITCMTYNGLAIFAGTEGSGIIRSNDGGNTWEQVNKGLPNLRINRLVSSGMTLFAGTNEGVYRSIDNGMVWELNAFKGRSIFVLSADSNAVFVGGSSFYRSTDKGLSWQTVYNVNTNESVELVIVSGKIVCAQIGIGSKLIILSSDYGNTWKSIKSNEFSLIKDFIQSGTSLFFAANFGLFKTIDLGTTWQKIKLNDYIDRLFAFDDWIFASSGYRTYKSNDDGETWVPLNVSFTIAIYIPKIIYVVGSDSQNNALYKTTDYGKSFSIVNCYQSIFCFLPQSDRLCVGTDYGYFSMEINGNGPVVYHHIANPNRSEAGKVLCLGEDDTLIVIGTETGLYMYNDRRNYQYPDDGDGYSYFALASNEEYIFLGAYDGCYRMKKGSKLWKKTNQGSNKPVHTISVNNDLIAIGSDNGIFTSIDNGATWMQKNNGLTNLIIQGLFVENQLIISGTSTGVFISDDAGNSWRHTNNGLTNTNVRCVSKIANMYFAGTDAGVFYSSNKGVSWEQTPKDLVKSVITTFQRLNIDGDMQTLEVGTLMDGAYYIYNYELINSVEEQNTALNTIHIFPNSASDYITVELGKETSDCRVDIYDLYGSCVGRYTVGNVGRSVIKTDNLSSGVYTVRVQYGDKTATKTIAIIK